MVGDPWGATYTGDGSRYSAGQQRAMEREAEEQEAITARAVRWLGHYCEYGPPTGTECVCANLIFPDDFASHAETCRALRREVE